MVEDADELPATGASMRLRKYAQISSTEPSRASERASSKTKTGYFSISSICFTGSRSLEFDVRPGSAHLGLW